MLSWVSLMMSEPQRPKRTSVGSVQPHSAVAPLNPLTLTKLVVCHAGGVASARRGLFYGVWLGGLFSLFRNHVASLKEQAQLAEEHERLAQVFAASCESSGQQQMAFPTLNIIFRQAISCRYRSPLLLVHTLACVLIIV